MVKGQKVLVNQLGETYEATILEVYPTFIALDANGIYQEAQHSEVSLITEFIPSIDNTIHVTYNGYNWNVWVTDNNLTVELFGDNSTGTKTDCMYQARIARNKLGKHWTIEAETLSKKAKSDNMKQVWKESRKSGYSKLWA